jgi:hypothetical protein
MKPLKLLLLVLAMAFDSGAQAQTPDSDLSFSGEIQGF